MARDNERMREDAAGIGPEPGIQSRLHRLSESHHYRIAGGEPDIRGWEVRNLAGNHLGEVDDLLIDPHRGEVVMLDVDLDDSSDHINLPIRGVQLDRSTRSVIVDTGDIRDARAALMGDRDRDGDRDVDDLRARGVREHAAIDREDVRDRAEIERDDSPRDVRYGAMRERDTDDRDIRDRDTSEGNVVEETVIERRPIVEEVVVRRKVVDEE